MNGFPTRAPIELEDRPRQEQWLIDGLWGRQAVGIVGGEPKCGKSFLALDFAVAVAAGVPCLRRFAADEPGPVLLFAAEDAGHIVRARLEGIARAAGARFETLDIAVIDVPTLRLDHRNDRQRLLDTVERVGPRLVVLDPLVRLHAVDENAVAEVAPILGFLRDIQRRFETAVLLVHHARKSGAARPGQALRGSSELHAWGDSNLYLRRRDRQILMTVEHRAAPGLNDIEIELADDGKGPALRLRQLETAGAAPEPETVERRILKILAQAETPLSPASENAPHCATQPSPPRSTSSSAKDASSASPEDAIAPSPPWRTGRLRQPPPTTERTNRTRSRLPFPGPTLRR